MPPTPNEIYEKYKSMSKPDICKTKAGLLAGIPEADIANLALQDKQAEDREKFEKELINLQHDLNKEIINIQNQFNKELSDKQTKLYKSLQRITVIATIFAAIIGAIVGGFSQYIIPNFFEPQSQRIKSK